MGVGLGLLGRAGAASGVDDEALVRARVTGPLRMENAGIIHMPAMKEHLAVTRPAQEDGDDTALAWIVTTRHGRSTFWHDGGTGRYQAFAGDDVKAGVGRVRPNRLRETSVREQGATVLSGRMFSARLGPTAACTIQPERRAIDGDLSAPPSARSRLRSTRRKLLRADPLVEFLVLLLYANARVDRRHCDAVVVEKPAFVEGYGRGVPHLPGRTDDRVLSGILHHHRRRNQLQDRFVCPDMWEPYLKGPGRDAPRPCIISTALLS